MILRHFLSIHGNLCLAMTTYEPASHMVTGDVGHVFRGT